jgi:hypothetical protein
MIKVWEKGCSRFAQALCVQSEEETMANLNRLMTLAGTVAAGEFSADGELVSYQATSRGRPLATSRRYAQASLYTDQSGDTTA